MPWQKRLRRGGLSRYSTGENQWKTKFGFRRASPVVALCSITWAEGGPAARVVAHDGGYRSLRRIYECASQAVAHDEIWRSVWSINEHASQPVGHDEVWRSVLPDDESTSRAVSNFLSRCGQSREHEQPGDNKGKMSIVHG